MLAPLVLLTMEKVRNNPQCLYWTCSLVVMGFMANRLNVSITGLQASSGIYYVPKWTEFAATLDGADGGGDGVPVCGDLSGYSSEEPDSAMDGEGRGGLRILFPTN